MHSFSPQNEFSIFLDFFLNQKKEIVTKKTNSRKLQKNSNSVLQIITNNLPCAAFIINYKTGQFDYISNRTSEIVGYPLKTLYKKNLEKAWKDIVHPKDKEQTLKKAYQKITAFINTLTLEELKKHRFTYNYRALKSDGTYMKLLQEKVFIETGENENQLYSINVITDITSHKKDNSLVLNIYKYDTRKGYQLISSEIIFHDDLYPGISKREHEVIDLIIRNKTSKEIGEILFISEFTVKAHRRNLLKKLNCNNSNDLRNYVLANGYK